MAQTFDGAQYPDALRFTLSSSVNEATQVVIPSTAVKVSIKFASNAGKVAFEGTDGSAINANYADVAANAWAEMSLGDGINVSNGIGSIYVASATASTVCTVVIEG